jgi:glycosyltransferase involved in cell wall biosynthesis
VGERNRPLTFKRLARRIERWVLRNATVVVVVSRPFCEYLKVHQLDERRVVVVPNAVDPADWPENPLKARDRQGEDGAALRVGSVAAFVDWHRLDLLIEAFASLEPKENMRLVLVGDGPALPAAKAHAERLGCIDRVEFTGRVPHGRVRELLAGFNIAVTANSNDYASPVKIFEYMAAGCAIVAPAYPAIADVLADGETALLFPPLDEEAMREQLRRLVCQPQLRARLGRQARERVLRHHTWSQNAQRVLGQLALVRLGRGANAARHTDLGGAS